MTGFVPQDTTLSLLSGSVSRARLIQDVAATLLSGGSRARLVQDVPLVVIQNSSNAIFAGDILLLIGTNSFSATFITGQFFDAANNPLAGGTVTFDLGTDAHVIGGTGVQVLAGRQVAVILDSNGRIPPNTAIWSNSILSNDGMGNLTIYHIRAYNVQGLLSWNHDYAKITSGPMGGGSFDVSNLTF